MSKLKERIQAHSQGAKAVKHEIPELPDDEGKPLVVYLHPLTFKQRAELFPLIQKDDLTFAPKAVRMSARDENGDPVFDLSDEKAMIYSRSTEWVERLSNIVLSTIGGDQDTEDLGES